MSDAELIYAAILPHLPTRAEIDSFVAENPWIGKVIAERSAKSPLYAEPMISAFAWMVKRKKFTLIKCFPLPLDILDAMAADFGESYLPFDR